MTVLLQKIAQVSAGQGAPQNANSFSEHGIPFIRAGNLEDLILTNDEYRSCELVDKEIAKEYKLKIYPKNTIVFAKSGMSATKGRIYCLQNDSYVVNHLATITPDTDRIEPSYLKYYFKKFSPQKLIKDSAYPSIRLEDIKAIQISLPTLEEQQRIIQILDQADSLRQKRQKAIALLDDYLKAVFFEISRLNNMHKINFFDLFNITTGKLNANAAEKDGHYPFFTCAKDDNYKINTPAFDCEALILSGNNANAEYSVKHYSGKFNAYQRTYILTLKNGFSYPFMRQALENKLKLLQSSSIGSNTKYLTMGIFKRINFEIPSFKVQKKFENTSIKIDDIKKRMLFQSNALETQFQALIQEAFKS